MSSKYPNEFDAFQTKKDALFEGDTDGDFVMAEDINNLQDTVIQIEKILGINPQGTYGSIENRLNKAEKGVSINVPGFFIYLGDPSTVNNSFSFEESSKYFTKFEHVVLGKNPSLEHNNLITEVRKSKAVRFYGYVDAGVNTLNTSVSEIGMKVLQWMTYGVEGIYLDNFGYDQGVSRERQNEILDIIHEHGMKAVLSAPKFSDVLTEATDETQNPSSLAPRLKNGDAYHYKGFAFTQLRTKRPFLDVLSTVRDLYYIRKELGVQIFATDSTYSGDVLGQEMYDYAHGLALLTSMDGFYLLANDLGESNSQIVTYGKLPLTGEWYEANPVIAFNHGNYERITQFGKFILDEDTVRIEGASIPSNLIKFIQNSLNGELIKDGSIEDGKIKEYDGYRLIDTINSITDRTVRVNFSGEDITGSIPKEALRANIIEAINLYTGTAKIQQAFIGDLDAGKITAGNIQAERISATVMAALDLYAANADIDKATINNALIGKLDVEHIAANVIKAINLETQTAQIEQARIGDLNADKITAGDISGDRIRANVVSAVNAYVDTMQGKHLQFDNAVIGSLKAGHIEAAVIEAINLESQTAKIKTARIGALDVENISAVVIQAINLEAQSAKIKAARIDNLTAGHIAAAVIEAINLETQTAQIKEARIGNLNASKITAGDITSERLTTNVVKAINAEIQTAQINEAKIGNLSAGKITAGDIHADRMKANVVDAVNLRAGVVTAGAAIIDSAAISTLAASHMQVHVISAINAYVGDLKVNKAKIGQLDADNIEANAITTVKLNANAITADKIDTDAILTRHIKADQIDADKIKANAITAGKINADAITAREIKAEAIESKHIKADAITADKISANAITATKILAGEINTGHLAADSVTTAKIKAGAVTADKILADSIKAIHIDALAIETEHISAGAVKAGQIDALAVTADKVAANAITADKIEAGAVKAGKIDADAVVARNIAANAITTEKINANAITAEKILANAITADKILADSITSDKIKAESINAKHIAVNSLSGDLIRARTLHGDKIIAGTLSANILEAGSITSVEIAAKTITTRNIASGAVDADIIRAGTITAGHISTRGLDAEEIEVYNGTTGQTLIKGGFLIVDGLDVGVVQSDNLVGNGLFLTASSMYGHIQENPDGVTESKEAILGNQANAQGGHQVWKVDLVNNIVLRKIDIPGRKPVDIAINMNEMYGYITVEGDDTVVQMALDSSNHGEVLTGVSKPTGKGPGRIVYTGDILGDHKHMFIMNTDPKDVNVPDMFTIMDGPPTSTDQELYIHHTIPIGNGPYDAVTSPAHQTFISLSKQGDIAMFDMSNADSTSWKVIKNIPIAAYGTDVYHGGLEGTVGFNGITGGDSSSKYGTSMAGMAGHQHVHGGYGTSDGSLLEYEPRGIALSADTGHLYVADYKNNQLVVVDIHGKAPYNPLTGDRRTGNLGINGNPFPGGPPPTAPTEPTTPPVHHHSIKIEEDPALQKMVMEIQAGETGGHAGHGGGMPLATVDTTTRWVRYRIPIGDSPDFVKVINGKIFVTLEGSGQVAVIDEADILAEIALDKAHYASWNEFFPMRALPTWNVRSVYVGSKPGYMHVVPQMGLKGTIFVSLTGQNQIGVLDVETETISRYINTGASPKGVAVTKDGKYMYVVNHGGGGELSFVYPNGAYVGDPYLGLEGGVEYQGAEHWVPSRSLTHIDKDTGVVLSQSKVEFRVNEPFLNEGGYAKLSVFGKDIGQGRVFAKVEQDITSVTNYSNGNNVTDVDNQRLDSDGDWRTYRPRLGWINGSVKDIQIFSEKKGETLERGTDNKTFRPSKDWIEEPTKPLIFKGTTGNYVELRPDEYAIYYQDNADPRIVFNELVPADMQIYSSSYFYKTIPTSADYDMFYDESGDPRIKFKEKLADGSWVTADFVHRDNRYWKPHNGSVLLAIENSSSPNFYTQFEIEEFVPKFVSIDNLQTAPFTFAPIHNPSRSDGKYTGIQYSMGTNRAKGKVVTSSKAPTSGSLSSIVDELEPIMEMDHSTMPMSIMHAFGEEVAFAAGLTSVTVDLGKKFMVGKLNITHAFHKYRKYHKTKTEVSEDGVTWKVVYDSAVSGEYNEFGPMADHIHYGKEIFFNASPVRYVRDWANGYVEYDANWSNPVERTGSHWTEIRAFADWEFEEHYKYADNTAEAGTQMATNGKGVVTTDISKAHIEIDIPIEFTSWWWMTYLVGPEFGQLDVEMPTVMGGSHSLFQDGTYVNKVAHRHIMSWPPSANIKSDPEKNIKAGMHKAVIRQKSGKVTVDRFRFEDYQYLTKSSMEIPKDSSLNFTRHKLVPNQAQWYKGTDIQSTEGPYDTPRINTDTKQRDYSVPIKYRFIVIARMEPAGALEERGTAYMTSAIFETGKLSSHWRMSQTQDSFAGSRIEAWDPQLPHKTGIQSFHLANGAVRGSKLMALSVMNHHISPYARIHESKLDLDYATHGHGKMTYIEIEDMPGVKQPLFISNKATLDSIEGWAGHGDAYGIESTMARGDHKHPEYISVSQAGVIEQSLTIKGNIILQPSDSGVPGLVDGVDVSVLKTTVDNHLKEDGVSHPVATPSTTVGGVNGKAGFISGDNQRKLNAIKEGATKTESSTTNGNIKIDGVEQIVFTHLATDGNKHVPANGTTNLNKVLKATGTAGSYNWGSVAYLELTGAPTSTVSNIDDAVTKRHTQNTDIGTTSTVFTIGSATNATTTALGLQFGSATLNPYLRWSGTSFELYKDWNAGVADVWSDLKALTFRNASGVEVSYAGHEHTWTEITSKPTTFTPPIATAGILGGVKQGTNISISADGTISGAYGLATTSTNGLFAATDKDRLNKMSDGANKVLNSETNGVITIDGVNVTVFTHATGAGNNHIPTGGAVNQFLRYSTSGVAIWSGITFGEVTGTVSSAQHGTQTVDTLHALATTTANGFMSKENVIKLGGLSDGATKTENSTTNGSIKINGVETVVFAHLTGAGNNHVPTAGASGNFLKWSAAGVASWANIAWADIKSGVPTTFAPSAHSHIVANITDFYSNVYTKTEVDNAVANGGDIKASQLNLFSNTNTFNKNGLAIKIQPATAPPVNTILFQLSTYTGSSLVTMDSEGDVVVEGNLVVKGTTTYNQEQSVEGDMNITGNLNVTGSSVLGDDPTDQTTIRGSLRLEGDLQLSGKSMEVARFTVYGIGGDLQFQTDSTVFEEIISHYSTFSAAAIGPHLPPVSSGAVRRYRIGVAYSTVGLASDAVFQVVELGTTTKIAEFTLPTVNGPATGMVRHFVSSEFTTNSLANTTFKAKSAGAGKDLVIKYIEVIAFDYYN